MPTPDVGAPTYDLAKWKKLDLEGVHLPTPNHSSGKSMILQMGGGGANILYIWPIFAKKKPAWK